MHKPDARTLLGPNSLLFQIITGSTLGFLLGIACQWYSPLLVLGVLTVVLMVYAILKRTEIALVGILIITSSIVFEDQLPTISMGVSLHIPDILLLMSFGVVLIRWMVEPGFRIVKTPLDRPLLAFYCVTLLSTFIAINLSSVDIVPARRALRILSYYLTFFVVTNLVKERRQINFLLKSFFVLATIVSIAMVLQYILGTSNPLLPGRIEALNTQGDIYENVVRILPPGYSLLLVSFITIFCIMTVEKFKPMMALFFFQFCLLGVALLLTFLRSYWATLIIIFIFLAYIVRGHDRQRLISWGAMLLFITMIAIAFIFRKPDSNAAGLIRASSDRLGTLLVSETFQGSDGSLNWRMIENDYAISAIAKHPWIGMGMGFIYRPWDSRLDQRDPTRSSLDFRAFIHNGHLWILLQSGLLGYLCLMWLSLIFLMRGFKHWRKITDHKLRGVVLGFTLAYLAVLISAVVNSSFTQWRWTPLIGMMMGLNEVIYMKFLKVGPTD